MRILALDAALGGFSAALDDGGRVTAVATGQGDALERGLGIVADLLAQAGLALPDLDRLAVGLGPGSFTGVRIAISYAKALAYGSGLPLVGISSYDAVTPPGIAGPVLAIVGGRRGVICARFTGADGNRVACGPVAEVLDRVLIGRPQELTVAGNTEDVLAQIAERAWTVRALPPLAENPAVAIALLARTATPSSSPHALAPDYGEAPAVTPPASRR